MRAGFLISLCTSSIARSTSSVRSIPALSLVPKAAKLLRSWLMLVAPMIVEMVNHRALRVPQGFMERCKPVECSIKGCNYASRQNVGDLSHIVGKRGQLCQAAIMLTGKMHMPAAPAPCPLVSQSPRISTLPRAPVPC